MTRLGFAFLLATGLAVGAAGNADAAKGEIVVAGCTSFVVPFCTLITTPGGKTYALNVGVLLPVPLNAGVTVTGTKAGDVSLCGHTPLNVSKWHPNRLHCPLK